jgi:cysteine-rich repeat protein
VGGAPTFPVTALAGGPVPAGFNVLQINLEQCDDGNMNNNDSCVARNADADPQLECMYALCGDGFAYTGAVTDAANPNAKEECDDHDVQGLTGGPDVAGLNNTDSCLDSCKWNSCHDGWMYASKTDNGNTNALEACDDGNAANTDNCVGTCALATCGDGFLNAGVDPAGSPSAGIVEQCDDADGTGAGDNCDATLSGKCTIKGAAGSVCGNGVIDPGEQCDDGNIGAPTGSGGPANPIIGCGTAAQGWPIFANGKNGTNASCTCNCMWNKCGDGQNYAAVTNPTNPNPLETCDDGNSNNRDACINSCVPAACGDGFVRLGVEQCDDGNAVNTDGCTNGCLVPRCGDGVVQAGEECDDGNGSNTDACTNVCKNAACGDLFIGPNESCDNGVANGAPGNNCRANCVLTTCGNGTNDGGGEQCDDGNTSNNDTCTNACLNNVCGDGFVSPTEQCDDGNTVNTDSCTNACLWNTCGDGVRYLQVTNAANPNPVERCDSHTPARGLTVPPYKQALFGGGVGPALLDGGGYDGDGFNDEGDGVCTDDCKLQCFPNRTWATTWKTNTYCVFFPESYGDGTPGAPYGNPPMGVNADGNHPPVRPGPNPRVGAAVSGAEAYCQGFGVGAHLVKLTSMTDNVTVNTLAIAANAGGILPTNGAFTPVYLGLVDRWKEDNAVDPPGSWHWIGDNSAVSTYVNWDPATSGVPAKPEPNDFPGTNTDTPGEQDCGVFYIGGAATAPLWHDFPCGAGGSFTAGFACEFPLPAPGSP